MTDGRFSTLLSQFSKSKRLVINQIMWVYSNPYTDFPTTFSVRFPPVVLAVLAQPILKKNPINQTKRKNPKPSYESFSQANNFSS